MFLDGKWVVWGGKMVFWGGLGCFDGPNRNIYVCCVVVLRDRMLICIM